MTNVETDSMNMGKHVKELSKVCWDMFRATGAMFEEEQLKFINMSAAMRLESMDQEAEPPGTPKGSWNARSSRTCAASAATSQC